MFRASLKNSAAQIAAIASLLLLQASDGNATTIQENTAYGLHGSFGIVAQSIGGGGGGTAPATYLLFGTYRNGSTVRTGNISGTILDSVTSHGVLDFVIYDYNATTLQTGAIVGHATGSLDTAWSEVRISTAHDVAGGMQNQASGGGLIFNLRGFLGGQAFNFSSGLEQAFAHANTGDYEGIYDNLIQHIGQNFSLALGDIGPNTADALNAWFTGNTTINGRAFELSADIHSQYSQVPEPATLALLGAGVLGCGLRRRIALPR